VEPAGEGVRSIGPLPDDADAGLLPLPGLAADAAIVKYVSQSLVRPFLAERFTVIPTISWSTAVSYDFCFQSVPRRSVVAASAVGVDLSTKPVLSLSKGSRQGLNTPLEYWLFVDGFTEMVQRLEPLVVLAYGRIPVVCHELVEVVAYPTRWTNIRAARKGRNESGFV